MRIAFNATALLSPLTGIGQYCRNLALGLLARQQLDIDFFYGAFWSRSVRDAPLPASAKLLPWLRNQLPFSYELRRFVQTHRFAAHAKQNHFDVYHEPNILPLPYDGVTVVTVHDLSWIRYPELHPTQRVRAMNKYFASGINQAALILTDSAFIKAELTAICGVNPDIIRTIPLGVEPVFKPQTADASFAVLKVLGLRYQRYLLVVGTLEPRKNLSVVLRAYRQLPPSIRAVYPLVIIGMPGWLNTELDAQLQPLIQAGHILQLGYVSREQLAVIVSAASMLLYPSIYEGFGLPPLEAMACGVPVIASNAASVPEVVGDAGILLDPGDDQGWLDAINRLLGDQALREHLAHLALARSRSFSWAYCVENTVVAYKEILGN